MNVENEGPRLKQFHYGNGRKTDIARLRRYAWQSAGILSVDVAALTDPWERQMLTNIAERLFGERMMRA